MNREHISIDSTWGIVCSYYVHASPNFRREPMRWMLLAASAVIAANLWLPGQAAEPASQPTGEDPITFEQYRDWRLHFIERRQTQLAMQLSAADLPARQKARLDQ